MGELQGQAHVGDSENLAFAVKGVVKVMTVHASDYAHDGVIDDSGVVAGQAQLVEVAVQQVE